MLGVLVIISIISAPGTTLELLDTKVGNSTAIELLTSNQDIILNFIKDKCEKNSGGNDAFEDLKSQPLEFSSCLEPIVNYTQFNEELEEARKTGSTGEVYDKYCLKYPKIYHCIEKTKNHIDLCLDPIEQDTLNKTLGFLNTLQPYLCSDDGNKIAMFVAKGGVECLQASFQELQKCFEEEEGASLTNLVKIVTTPKFLITDEDCINISRTRDCFFKIMNKCKQNTPANVVEAVFKFINREFSCNVTTGRKYYLTDYLIDDMDLMYIRVGMVITALITTVFLIILIQTIKVSLLKKS